MQRQRAARLKSTDWRARLDFDSQELKPDHGSVDGQRRGHGREHGFYGSSFNR